MTPIEHSDLESPQPNIIRDNEIDKLTVLKPIETVNADNDKHLALLTNLKPEHRSIPFDKIDLFAVTVTSNYQPLVSSTFNSSDYEYYDVNDTDLLNHTATRVNFKSNLIDTKNTFVKKSTNVNIDRITTLKLSGKIGDFALLETGELMRNLTEDDLKNGSLGTIVDTFDDKLGKKSKNQ